MSAAVTGSGRHRRPLQAAVTGGGRRRWQRPLHEQCPEAGCLNIKVVKTAPKKVTGTAFFWPADAKTKKVGVEQEKEKAAQVIFGSARLTPPNRLPKKTSPDLRPGALPFASCFFIGFVSDPDCGSLTALWVPFSAI
jgi:hypothetical protein